MSLASSKSIDLSEVTLPLIEPVDPHIDLAEALERLAGQRHVMFLDSADRHHELGRYSFLAADPFDWIEVPTGGRAALGELEAVLSRYSTAPIPGLPPFQGGAAGLWSYELGRSLENVPPAAIDEFCVPAMALGLYDVVLAVDHAEQQAWIVSQGFPEVDPSARAERAAARLAQFRAWLTAPLRAAAEDNGLEKDLIRLRLDELAPQHAVWGFRGLTSSMSAAQYLASVARAVEYIYAGDVFQVNLSQRLLHRAATSSLQLYRRLRERNAAPFGAYFDLGTFQLCSASPERFVAVRGGEVETRPIKGTRGRARSPEADLFLGDELRLSDKDRAENVMIVDLLRNDLSRVCRPESVRVTRLCGLESYAYVQHLVSVVEGRLRDDCSPIDLLQATLPGGSITGAPKIRAMEIISELEPTVRGAYCGSLGYIGFDGSMDSNILIRSITCGRGWWQLPVGGGVVAQSSPQAEYEETWQKAQGMLKALTP